MDRDQLQQLVLALVQNGADAIGGETGSVTLRCHEIEPERLLEHSEVYTNRLPRGRSVVIEVEDTGRGLDNRSRKRIFDLFFSTHGAGRGLGLATVMGNCSTTPRRALCTE